jgi:hypothetical protein
MARENFLFGCAHNGADASISFGGEVNVVASEVFKGTFINVVAIRACHLDNNGSGGELCARGDPNNFGSVDARANSDKVSKGGFSGSVVGAKRDEDCGCGQVSSLKALTPSGAGDAFLGKVRALRSVCGCALGDRVADEQAWSVEGTGGEGKSDKGKEKSVEGKALKG